MNKMSPNESETRFKDFMLASWLHLCTAGNDKPVF